MAIIGDLIDLAEVAENLTGIDVPGVGATSTNTPSGSRPGPIRGARLEYNIPALGGRLLMKEPFGNWFNLKPVYPEYGSFESGDNSGKPYTKRAGFRFKSYTILLKPGTQIICPKAKAADQRKRNADTSTITVKIGNISIGVSDDVTVKEFIEWLKSSNQKSNINGVISPTLRKYQWGGILHHANSAGGGGSSGGGNPNSNIPGNPFI